MARQKFALKRRVTAKYTAGWSGIDEWDTVGTHSILNARVKYSIDGDSAGYTWTVRVDPRAGASDRDIVRALFDTFAWGCRCEHDCCGHSQGYANHVEHKKRREWVVVGYSYLNI